MPRRRVPVNRRNEPVIEPEDSELSASDAVAEELPCGCPQLEREEWHEVESDWSDIAFLPFHLAAALGVPLGYQGLLRRLEEEAKRAGVRLPADPMVLVGEGRFRRPVWVEVEVPEEGLSRRLVRPGGFAFTMLASAAYGDMKRRVAELEELATARYGEKPSSLWAWYLTCRQCSGPRDFETLFVAHYAPGRPR